jgi:hypothetical protein
MSIAVAFPFAFFRAFQIVDALRVFKKPRMNGTFAQEIRSFDPVVRAIPGEVRRRPSAMA